MGCQVQNVGGCTGAVATCHVEKAPENHHAAITQGVDMVGKTAVKDLKLGDTAANDPKLAGAAYDGKAIPTDGSAYKIGNYVGQGYPDVNNNGPLDPKYAGMYEQYHAKLVDKYGEKKVATAIKIYEDAYQKNGIDKNLPEYSHHDKSIHYLIEQMNDDMSLNAEKLRASQDAQRNNYGGGGARMADAAGAVSLVLNAN